MKKKKKHAKKKLLNKKRKEIVVFQNSKIHEEPITVEVLPREKNISDSIHEFNLRLLLIPLILMVILGILSLFTTRTTRELKTQQLPMVSSVSANPYAYFTRSIEPPISAEAAIIMDSESKVIVYKKNPEVRFAMASTTKLMTALVAMEYFSSMDILTVTTPNVPGQTLGFPLGEQLYFKDLVYAMLLPSSNHAANVVAHNYPGGYDVFMIRMNEKAKALSLMNTQYADPAGLNDAGNYTTAVDLARLAAEVVHNAELSQIVATKNKVITNVSKTQNYSLNNLNILLGQSGVTGLKTGYTEGAGGVLATSVVVGGRTYIVVVMRSEDRFADTQILLSYLGTDLDLFTPQVVMGGTR